MKFGTVKTHTRKRKNGVSVVKQHKRGHKGAAHAKGHHKGVSPKDDGNDEKDMQGGVENTMDSSKGRGGKRTGVGVKTPKTASDSLMKK